MKASFFKPIMKMMDGDMDVAAELGYRDISSVTQKIFVTFDLSKVRHLLRTPHLNPSYKVRV